MSVYDSYLRARAAAEGRALPRASRRHRHLAEAPLVVCAYKLAGDPASPLAIMYGTDRSVPTLRVAPEPRNRTIRFGLLNPFAIDLLDYLAGYPADAEGALVAGAPQLIVPNVSTCQFLEVLGRSLRHPGRTGAIPPTTVQAGRHLAWFAQQSEHPGQALMLPITETLAAHWITGQSDYEDASLPALLGWIAPSPGFTPAQAAATAEGGPTAGPASDPQWDKTVLAPLIDAFNDARGRAEDVRTVAGLSGPITRAIDEALTTAWAATWTALDLLAALPEAAHVPDRRARDERAWAGWARRVSADDLRLANRLSDRAAVTLLAERERDTELVEAQETADDPLRFAALEVDGRGLRGVVSYAEPDRRLVPPGRRNRVARPLVQLSLGHQQTRFRPGDTLYWTERFGQVQIVLLEATLDSVTFEVVSGTNRRQGIALPLPTTLSATVWLTALNPTAGPFKPLHDQRDVWTHRPPATPDTSVNDINSDTPPPPISSPAA